MQVIHVEGKPPQSLDPLVLVIGKFDGVHVGHRFILNTARSFLGEAKLAVMTFWPHPGFVLFGKQGYDRSLTPVADKARLLADCGVERLYQIHFTKAYALTSAQTFVHNHLRDLNLQHVVVGSDFRFGQGGAADAAQLQALCAQMNVPVKVMDPVEEGRVKVSSSRIRAALLEGDVEEAAVLLGRDYSVTGQVVHGQALGRQLGFRTANLAGLEEYVLPAPGVYGVKVAIEDAFLPADRSREPLLGVLNAGFRPTVDGRDFRLEVHILDFTGDLYGAKLRVEFVRRIRGEQKFNNLAELKSQIARDIEAVQVLALQ